jgi:hypothetical protein
MNPNVRSRRQFLRGAGGITLSLPFLETFATKQAFAQGAMRRFVVFFFPEGVYQARGTKDTSTRDEWWPKPGSGPTDFTMNVGMMPFAQYRSDLVLVKGITLKSIVERGGDPHASSMVHLLTGGHPDSIDQVIGKAIGKGYKYPTLEFAVKAPHTIKGRLVYSNRTTVAQMQSPKEAFMRLFAGGVTTTLGPAEPGGSGAAGPDPALIASLNSRRKSVLDMVKEDLGALAGQLGAADRPRMQQYLEALREVEKTLYVAVPTGGQPAGKASAPAASASCANPSVGLPPEGGENLDTLGRSLTDVMLLALQCNLTPVTTFQWLQSGNAEKFVFLGFPADNGGHHGFVHNDSGVPEQTVRWKQTIKYFAERFAALITRMKQINEGPRSMFDNSIVLLCSHFGHGGGHTNHNVPFIVAGSGGGAIKTGRFLDLGEAVPHNRLLTSLAQTFGLDVQMGSAERYGAGGLPGFAG